VQVTSNVRQHKLAGRQAFVLKTISRLRKPARKHPRKSSDESHRIIFQSLIEQLAGKNVE
jgi:hypothetical protein